MDKQYDGYRSISNDSIREHLERKKKNYEIMHYYTLLEGKEQPAIIEKSYKGKKKEEYKDNEIDISHLEEIGLTIDDLIFFPKEITKALRIASCQNWYDITLSEKNKAVRLNRTNRCMDKFCTNCKRQRVAQLLAQTMPHIEKLMLKYEPYLQTVTVPNVTAWELTDTVNKYLKKYRDFYRFYSEKITTKHAHKTRKYTVKAAIRALEITYNKKENTYHPHIHTLLFIEKHSDCPSDWFEKKITGEWNYKINKYNMISEADIELRTLWTKLYNDISRSSKTTIDNYMCDIKPINGIEGILEVLKYSFKTSDIISYNVFETLYMATFKKRMKQGYGELYNVKFDDNEPLNEEAIDEIFSDDGEELTVQTKELIEEFADYEKLKKCSQKELLKIIDKHIED